MHNNQTYRRHLTLSIIVLITSASWIWISRDVTGELTGGKSPSPQVGFPAPDFTLMNMEGDQVSLSDYRGQAVLVNLWASWCEPCRTEMPAMQKIHEKYQGKGFVILAVNITSQDSREAAVAFANELGLTFPILFDLDGSVAAAYQMRAFPSSYFIDKNGIIREIVIGGPMAEALLQVRAEQLIKEIK